MENRKEEDIEFERCIDILAKLVEQYGAEVLAEVEDDRTESKAVVHNKKGIA